MSSTLPLETLGSLAFFLAATLYQGNPNRKRKLWNIVSTHAGTAGILLHINTKFTIGKLKFPLSQRFVLNRPILVIYMCWSRYVTELVVSVIK